MFLVLAVQNKRILCYEACVEVRYFLNLVSLFLTSFFTKQTREPKFRVLGSEVCIDGTATSPLLHDSIAELELSEVRVSEDVDFIDAFEAEYGMCVPSACKS